MARRVGDKPTIADVLASNHRATHGPDAIHESRALAEELGEVAGEVGDRRLQALAHVRLLDHLLGLGDIDGVERELEALRELTETRTERYFTWLLTVLRANHALLQGRLEDFETLARDAYTHRFEGHDETAAQTFRMQMGFLRTEQGQLEELVQTFQGVVAEYPQLAAWRCALAFIYAQLDRTDQARQELEALARADFRDFPRDADWLPSMSLLPEVVIILGDIPRAQLLYKLLLPYANRCVVIFGLLCQGSTSRPLGLLATMLSRYEDAVGHFEQALKMHAKIRSPLWIVRTQQDYACMLLARGQPSDHDKALKLLNQALITADALGLDALADTTRTLKIAADAAAPPSISAASAEEAPAGRGA
jgi:tetratricopeptide (TPR) repeat protein